MDSADRPIAVISRPEQAVSLLRPIRRQILAALGSPCSAATVARQLGLPRQKVNYHLRELEKSDLVELVEERKRGNCTERLLQARAGSYALSAEALGTMAADPEAIGNRLSSAYLTALASRAVHELGAMKDRADLAGERLATFSFQGEVRFRTPQTRAAFSQELTRLMGELLRKFHDGTGGGPLHRVIVGSYPHPASAGRGAAAEAVVQDAREPTA